MINNIRDFDVEAPVLLNCWKHHKEFIQNRIRRVVMEGEEAIQKLPSQIVTIGDSLLDLYTGLLNPYDVSIFIKSELKKRSIVSRQSYAKWIKDSKNNYRTIYLPDSSFWTSRLGQKERYIHIHPGRYSPHTTRVRALTLKTAITVLSWSKIHKSSPSNINIINYIRGEILNASPIKTVSNKYGLGKVISLFEV